MSEDRAPRGMDKANFVTGLVLSVLGAFVVHVSWNMPRFEAQAAQPFSVPGIVPGLLGAILALMGLVLVLRAARRGGHRLSFAGKDVRRWSGRPSVRRFLIALGLCLAYGLGLLGRLPYAWATGSFVTVFILAFEFAPAETWCVRGRRAATALAQGAIVAGIVTLVFEKLFLVTLP